MVTLKFSVSQGTHWWAGYLQIGGTGDRIGQYQSVRVEATKTLPAQIDEGKYC